MGNDFTIGKYVYNDVKMFTGGVVIPASRDASHLQKGKDT